MTIMMACLIVVFVGENMAMMFGREIHPVLVTFIPHVVFLVVLLASIRLYRLGRGNPTPVLAGFAAIVWALLTIADRAMKRYLESRK
jgi:hypothetical protein